MSFRALLSAAAVMLALACLPAPRDAGSGLPGDGQKARPEERLDPVVLHPGPVARDGALALAAVFPTIGRYAVSGLQSLRGAQLAVEELNRAGGVRGRRLRLVEYRTGSYFVDARQAATLAAQAGVLAIVGANASDLSLAVAEEAENEGILQVTNVSTASDLTWDPTSGRVRPFVFRMCASDDVIGELLASFARDRLGAKRVAILYEVGRSYSSHLARSFRRQFEDAPEGRSVSEFFYLGLETDFRPQLRLIKELDPDVVFLPGSFPDATLVAAQARQIGLEATYLGGDAWSSPLLFQNGAPPGEAYYVELCAPAPSIERAVAEPQGSEPPGCRAVLAYDAVRTIAAGLDSLGRLEDRELDADLRHTRRRLRDAVARIEATGVTGRIRFDERGNRRQGVALYSVEDSPRGARALLHGWLGEP